MTSPDNSQNDTSELNAQDKIINRLLNIDDEIDRRAEFPGSSISCEATKATILEEIRADLAQREQAAELRGRIDQMLVEQEARRMSDNAHKMAHPEIKLPRGLPLGWQKRMRDLQDRLATLQATKPEKGTENGTN